MLQGTVRQVKLTFTLIVLGKGHVRANLRRAVVKVGQSHGMEQANNDSLVQVNAR